MDLSYHAKVLMNTLHLRPLGNLSGLNKGMKNIRSENTFLHVLSQNSHSKKLVAIDYQINSDKKLPKFKNQ